MVQKILDRSVDMVLVGAGVMGLMSALELAAVGRSVCLVDRGRAGREASWAGGGIISPLYPWRYPTEITALASWSQAAYPGLIAHLSDQTSVDPELLINGMLVTATDERAQALAWGSGMHPKVQVIDAARAGELEPHVTLSETPLWMPEIASVRTPRLGKALRAACLAHPAIDLIEHQTAELGGTLEAPEVRVNGQRLICERVGITGGAWTGKLCAAFGVSCAIKPMKGQMLLFAPCHLVSRVVLSNGRYAIPRGDGRLVFGSTLEDVGFDPIPDRAALDSLYQSALQMVPQLASVELEAQWTGLRPGSSNGIPWIGALSDRLWVNAGHFRNGVVLAPASSRLFADLVCGRTPIVEPAAYHPERVHSG